MGAKLYRGGRPGLPLEERSDRKVTIRFNPDEFRSLKERKDTTMAKDMSTFIRDVCLQKPLPFRTQMDSFQEEALSLLVEMRADLLRIGVNVNQSTRRINASTDYRDLQLQVGQMGSEVERIQVQFAQIIDALSGQLQPDPISP